MTALTQQQQQQNQQEKYGIGTARPDLLDVQEESSEPGGHLPVGAALDEQPQQRALGEGHL